MQNREASVTNRIALLLAPLAAPCVLGLLVVIWRLFKASDDFIHGAGFDAQVIFVAIPVSYLIAILFGYPVYFVLKRQGWLNARALFLAGALVGALSLNAIIGLLLGPRAAGWIFALIGALLGFSVACLYLLLRRIKK